MAIPQNFPSTAPEPNRLLGVGLIMMGAVVAIGLVLLLLNSGIENSYPYLFVLPWAIGLSVVVLAPSAYLYYHDRFTFYDPIVFATWSYIFPAFVLGGIVLAFGYSEPFYLSFIQDEHYNLPYAIVIVALGFGGLSLGYLMPMGRWVGARIERLLPVRQFEPNALIIPGIALLFLGIFNSIAALFLGVIGYQRTIELNAYDGVVFLTTLFWTQGTFLLWYVIFKQQRIEPQTVVIGALLLVASLAKALMAGNRAGLLGAFMTGGLAYLLAGRKLNLKQGVAAGVLLTLCLLLGMIYGTKFRELKGSDAQVGVEQYTENIFSTLENVGGNDIFDSLEYAFLSFAWRIDTVSSVAVVASNYEQLRPYEESYGLNDNIVRDLTTFFIPRVIWPDKPIPSDPLRYSDLYFNYPENAFAITPFADLLRNFGLIGVPIGMFLFGILLRIIYRALIEDQPRIFWRAMLFFMLVISVSYESFYGLLIPYLFKVGFTSIVGILIVMLVAKAMGNRSTNVV